MPLIWLLVALVVLTGGVVMKDIMTHYTVANKWKLLAKYWADKNGLSLSLVLAVIFQESNGNEKAVGKTGDFGLMQITKPALTDFNNANGKDYSTSDLLNANINVEVGCWILAQRIDKMESVFSGLRAYNAGVAGATNNPTLSKQYAESVLQHETIMKGVLA